MKLSSNLICLCISLLLTACNSGFFTGSNANTAGRGVTGGNTSGTTSGTTSTGGSTSGTTSTVPSGSVTSGGSTSGTTSGVTGGGGSGTTSGGLGSGGGQACISDNVDMNIMVLLDTTGSMGSQASQVRSGIPALLSQIDQIKASVSQKIKTFRLGFIGYVDQVRVKDGQTLILPPTDNMDTAKNYINTWSQSWSDTSDLPEGGLWAYQTALQLMQQTQASAGRDGINIAVVITDAWSHDGTACGNDCHGDRRSNTTGIEALFKSDAGKAILIFDFAPQSGSYGAFVDDTKNKFGSPLGQWEALRGMWKQIRNLTGSQAGGHLGDKIDNGATGFQNMVTQITQQIKVCQ